MIKIIKERTPETIVDYTIEFFYKNDPDAGFCFPANKDETPAFEKMCTEAKVNYERCLTDVRLTGPEFTVNKRTYINPAVGKCICGVEVVLECDHSGAVRCDCGRWYNLFGQELRDPKYWEED